MTTELSIPQVTQKSTTQNGQATKAKQPNMLEAALRYAARGWHVFPCHTPITKEGWSCSCEAWRRKKDPNYNCKWVGKHPRIKGGVLNATTDPDQIKEWWKQWPQANIGVNCGASGLIVLDEDAYKEVYGDLGDLLSPDEQETVKQLSGSHQGSHLVYAMPEGKAYGNAEGDLPDGLNIRGVGGYIIVEPSLHKSGNRYEWIEGYGPDEMELQTLPEPLQTILDAAQEKSPKNKAVMFTEATTEAPDMAQWHISKEIRQLISKAPVIGERSEADYKVCLSLVYAGATDDDILAVFEHNPIGKDGKFAESGKRYLSLTISKARAYMDEHPRTAVDIDVTPAEKPIVLADLLDELTADTDKHALKAWAIENALRCSKLDLMDVARLKAELSRLKVPSTFLDREWPQLMNAAKAEAQKNAAKEIDAPELPQRFLTWPYDVQDGRIGQWKEFKNDKTGEETEVFYPLCNFNAWIVADVAADDGEEISRKIAIAGTLDTGLSLPEIEIDADEFEFMKWPVAKWGSRVNIEPFDGARSILRHAIQKLSADKMTDRQTFTHTGWRVIDGNRVFLNAGGAIGADDVSVKPPHELRNYIFPNDAAVSVKDAMRASVDLLDTAPIRVSGPAWASMYLAPLSEIIAPVFTVSINGGSGSLKSSLSAVMLNHFGAKFTEYAMPADWLGTANSLEKLCFHAKDVPLIIDDFRPSTSPQESRHLQESASRITRAVGNRQGRSRLDSNSKFQRSYIPRGMVLMTAERNAMGKSTNSRILTVDVEPGDINSVKLAEAQKQRHVYQYAMRGFIESVRKDWDELAIALPERVIELRTENSGNGHHKRLPNATAILFTAFEAAMSFALEVGAIDEAECVRRLKECQEALHDIERLQSEATESEDPALKYITILASLIAADKAHVDGKGDKVMPLGMCLSEKLGWHDGTSVYLLPGAYNTVCKYAAVEGWSFPSDEVTLRKELDRAGWLSKKDPERNTTKQRDPNSKKLMNVTAISYERFALLLIELGYDLKLPAVTK